MNLQEIKERIERRRQEGLPIVVEIPSEKMLELIAEVERLQAENALYLRDLKIVEKENDRLHQEEIKRLQEENKRLKAELVDWQERTRLYHNTVVDLMQDEENETPN